MSELGSTCTHTRSLLDARIEPKVREETRLNRNQPLPLPTFSSLEDVTGTDENRDVWNGSWFFPRGVTFRSLFAFCKGKNSGQQVVRERKEEESKIVFLSSFRQNEEMGKMAQHAIRKLILRARGDGGLSNGKNYSYS